MSAIKSFLENKIYALAQETGYSEKFLWDHWDSVLAEDGDWEYFEAVTRELDW